MDKNAKIILVVAIIAIVALFAWYLLSIQGMVSMQEEVEGIVAEANATTNDVLCAMYFCESDADCRDPEGGGQYCGDNAKCVGTFCEPI